MPCDALVTIFTIIELLSFLAQLRAHPVSLSLHDPWALGVGLVVWYASVCKVSLVIVEAPIELLAILR